MQLLHKALMASQGWEENSRTTGLGLVTTQLLLLHAKEWSKGCSQDYSFSQCLPIRRLKVGVDTGGTELPLWLEPALFYCSGKDNRDPCVLCLVETKSPVFAFSFEGLCYSYKLLFASVGWDAFTLVTIRSYLHGSFSPIMSPTWHCFISSFIINKFVI